MPSTCTVTLPPAAPASAASFTGSLWGSVWSSEGGGGEQMQQACTHSHTLEAQAVLMLGEVQGAPFNIHVDDSQAPHPRELTTPRPRTHLEYSTVATASASPASPPAAAATAAASTATPGAASTATKSTALPRSALPTLTLGREGVGVGGSMASGGSGCECGNTTGEHPCRRMLTHTHMLTTRTSPCLSAAAS